MAVVYLSLGTNLGNKEENLNKAVEKINDKIGKVTSLSSFYETAPWGFESDNSFLNAAACVITEHKPLEVLELTQLIEKELGRTLKSTDGVYHDRLIDIDILIYDDLILDTPQLKVPHPLMTERDFVMNPLHEIAPELVNPLTGKKLFSN